MQVPSGETQWNWDAEATDINGINGINGDENGTNVPKEVGAVTCWFGGFKMH